MEDEDEDAVRVMQEHIIANRDRLEPMRDEVTAVLRAYSATARDVVALVGYMIASLELLGFDPGELLDALRQAHARRESKRARKEFVS